MCLIIDYKFSSWHLMRLKGSYKYIYMCRVLSGGAHSQLVTLKIIPASQSVWKEVNSSCPFLWLALGQGICY
jgi:hypothetical protein